jgi:hypothetical protein
MTETSRAYLSDGDDLDARDTCAVALTLCAAWLARNEPEAEIDAEIEDGVWHRINLLQAANIALADLREQNRGC